MEILYGISAKRISCISISNSGMFSYHPIKRQHLVQHLDDILHEPMILFKTKEDALSFSKYATSRLDPVTMGNCPSWVCPIVKLSNAVNFHQSEWKAVKQSSFEMFHDSANSLEARQNFMRFNQRIHGVQIYAIIVERLNTAICTLEEITYTDDKNSTVSLDAQENCCKRSRCRIL